MGCDIHVHVEVKIKGKWLHYGVYFVERNYLLFAILAGVRNYDKVLPFVEPRGIPKDVSDLTLFDWERSETDWHTPSYINDREVEALNARLLAAKAIKHPDTISDCLKGFYLFGNNMDSYVQYPEDGKRLFGMGYEASRIVFWFDN
jgi:hypothetical protein